MVQKRFLLISIIPQHVTDEEAFDHLKELKSLVDSYGGLVVDWVLQRREVHDKGSYIGEGKMREAVELIKKEKIDMVVLNAVVKPGQIYDMKKAFMKSNFHIEVWDRVDLILQIFSKNAHTAEARLQIELAAMRHMGPRIYGMGMELSRQTGGIGGRGIGETNTERMRRHWREQIKKTKDKLTKLTQDRERQLERRRRNGLKTISIVGYTNAGKTSLFNLLTGKEKLAKNELFATLDSIVGKVSLPESEQTILVSDTIGFIQDLPTDLIDAFKSTLLESVHADLLLHVIDASDKQMRYKIMVVEEILQDLKIFDKKHIYVFNKLDQADIDITSIQDEFRDHNPICISVSSGKNIDALINSIEHALL